MVAALAQLHIDVIEIEGLDSTLAQSGQQGKVFTVDAPIVRLLLSGKTDFDHSLFQGWN